MNEKNDYLSIAEFAEIVGISRQAVYNKLDNTFKQTNFKTVQELKNYVIQNFSGKQLKYGECQQQGSLYIFDITITEGTKQTNKRVIMQLKDGTDFVMSFNVN